MREEEGGRREEVGSRRVEVGGTRDQGPGLLLKFAKFGSVPSFGIGSSAELGMPSE